MGTQIPNLNHTHPINPNPTKNDETFRRTSPQNHPDDAILANALHHGYQPALGLTDFGDVYIGLVFSAYVLQAKIAQQPTENSTAIASLTADQRVRFD